MGRKVVFRAHTGECGTDTAEGFIYPDSTTNEQLDREAWDFGLSHAESYGVYPMECMPDDYDEDLEDSWDSDKFSDGIEGQWEEYDPKEHDGILTYGSNDSPQFIDYTK